LKRLETKKSVEETLKEGLARRGLKWAKIAISPK
jgi:hypothetical protein